MADFHQNGIITTLHNLGNRSLDEMESELTRFGLKRPLGLILPSLYSEIQTKALPKIVSDLVQVPYLSQIVVGLDRADEGQYRHALQFFQRFHNTIACCGTMVHGCAPLTPSSRPTGSHRESLAKAAMCGTAWAICWQPGEPNQLPCMTAIF